MTGCKKRSENTCKYAYERKRILVSLISCIHAYHIRVILQRIHVYSVVAPDNASYINAHGGTPVSSNLPEVPVAAGGSVDSIIRATPVNPNSLPEVPVGNSRRQH